MKGTIGLDKLVDFIQRIAAIDDSCNMALSDEGITVTAMDKSKTSMVHTQLSSKSFETFESGGNQKIGVDVNKFLTILRGIGEDKIDLEVAKGKIFVRSGSFAYSASVIDPSTITNEINKEKITDIMKSDKLTVSVQMSGQMLNEAINVISKVADVADIKATDGIMILQSPEGEAESIRLDLKEGELDVTFIKKGDANTRLSLDLVKSPVRALSHASKVIIDVGVNHPIVFSSEPDECGFVQYVVAPRIES